MLLLEVNLDAREGHVDGLTMGLSLGCLELQWNSYSFGRGTLTLTAVWTETPIVILPFLIHSHSTWYTLLTHLCSNSKQGNIEHICLFGISISAILLLLPTCSLPNYNDLI